MYPVLEFLMKKKNITKKEIANTLKISYSSCINKFAGKTEWKYSEMKKIKENYFSNLRTDDIFKQEII